MEADFFVGQKFRSVWRGDAESEIREKDWRRVEERIEQILGSMREELALWRGKLPQKSAGI